MAHNVEPSDIKVKWTWRNGGNKRYNGDTSQAKGDPQFLSKKTRIYQDHAVLRIRGERPLGLTIRRGQDIVHCDEVIEEKSWMKIYFKRRNLPSDFEVVISNGKGEAQTNFDIEDDY
ncbi:hypothetical protein BSL78_06968 [Apostichopus japonicus]|uniref:Uncharacterized protein n=1 Tax=Stichopus japonicus TaxID=307972 RepID=A0A2G8L733_STIJA|nr:hypothetical protein BSL78_06968 [Apostichopus japonicus]